MSTEVVAVSAISNEQPQSPSAPKPQNPVQKVNLLGMSRPELEHFLKPLERRNFVPDRS